jgi:YVTN family beta-propeller protein
MKRISFFIGPWGLRIFVLAWVVVVTSAIAIAQQVIATVPAGGGAYAVAVNPATNQIYVANWLDGTVTVIDGTTLSTTTVRVGSTPWSLAVNAVTNKIYVANSGSNTVTVIDGTNNSVIKTVSVGGYPESVAVNPATNKIYVANESSNTVTVIDGTNNTVIATVSVGTGPVWLAVNPATNNIYAANICGYDPSCYSPGTVTVIDGTNNTVIATVFVGSDPRFAAVNPVTNKIYVVNYADNTVTVIDGTNDSVIATVSVGSNPLYAAVNPVSNKIYVTGDGSNNVTVIDGTNDSVIKTVPAGSYPYWLAVNPVTNTIYVPNWMSNDVTVINGANDSVIKTLSVGNGPDTAAVNPATNKVYVPNSSSGSVSVIAGANATALQLVPVTPCRLVDTRNPIGEFGGPSIQSSTYRSFVIPDNQDCKIPSTAAAYSLNVTAVPHRPLGYLTIWPTGEDQPLVSTMNSLDGRVKANAAIVPAGYQGAVSVFVYMAGDKGDTDVVLDINGYFVSASSSSPAGPATLAFYPLTPCRVADTRNPKGPLGGPYLQGGQQRDFPVLASPCNIDPSAKAYSLNFTAVPQGPLGYLTVWPMGQQQPLASTLNAYTGTVTANAALIPAGANGEIMVFATNDTDLVIDVNGYFAPPGEGGLSLYPSAPCRVLDTRQSAGLFSGTIGSDVVESVCGPPESAEAYVFNATVVPQGSLGYLTLWPNGEQQPIVSTLNAPDGAIASNMAIVPTINGSIEAFALNLTQLILDISSYFAP